MIGGYIKRVSVQYVYFHLFRSFEKSSPGALALELNYLPYEISSFVNCFVFAATKWDLWSNCCRDACLKEYALWLGRDPFNSAVYWSRSRAGKHVHERQWTSALKWLRFYSIITLLPFIYLFIYLPFLKYIYLLFVAFFRYARPYVRTGSYTPGKVLWNICKIRCILGLPMLTHKFATVSRCTTWSRASRKIKLLFP